jgi:hypothetical protein
MYAKGMTTEIYNQPVSGSSEGVPLAESVHQLLKPSQTKRVFYL